MQKILELEKDIDAKQKLEMEIQELKGKLEVMQHMGGEDDSAVQEKIKEMKGELDEKIDDMKHLDEMNNALVLKERQSNDELQEARKLLIQVLYLIQFKLCHILSTLLKYQVLFLPISLPVLGFNLIPVKKNVWTLNNELLLIFFEGVE